MIKINTVRDKMRQLDNKYSPYYIRGLSDVKVYCYINELNYDRILIELNDKSRISVYFYFDRITKYLDHIDLEVYNHRVNRVTKYTFSKFAQFINVEFIYDMTLNLINGTKAFQ